MIKYTERLILGLLVASVTTNDNPDEEIKTSESMPMMIWNSFAFSSY